MKNAYKLFCYFVGTAYLYQVISEWWETLNEEQ